MSKRLKAKDVKPFREEQLLKQGGICPLCLREIEEGASVLDHDHKTGYCRGTLHRGCNSMLGKIENNRLRYGLKDDEALQAFLSNTLEYMSSSLGVLHHTYRTDEEKRLLRNKRARKARLKRRQE